MNPILISNPPFPPTPLSLLTPNEESTLVSCEAVIEKGIHHFRAVGAALLKIRDERLWRDGYNSFDHYCRSRWEFGANAGHRYLTASTIADKLENRLLEPPTKQSHAVALAILDDEQQHDVWKNLVNNGSGNGQGNITTQQVELAAKESFVKAQSPELSRAIQDGILSVKKAYKMSRVLKSASPRIKSMITQFGINGTSAVSIEAIAHLNGLAVEKSGGHEILDEIERTGGFIDVGGEQVHLSSANGRDIVDAVTNVRIQTRYAKQDPTKEFDIQIAEDTVGDTDLADCIMFGFGEDMEDKLKEKGYKILFVVAAKGDPEFDNERLTSKIRRRKNWLQSTISRILE